MGAAPITGSPNIVIMLGFDPSPALRQLIVGTALLPLTVLPILWWIPDLSDSSAVLMSCVRLFLVIAGAALFAFAIRIWWKPVLNAVEVRSIDGLSALLMALVVIGLMAALGDALRTRPLDLLLMMVFVFALNFGFQWLAANLLPVACNQPTAVSLSVISGNRNIALYLTALPASVTEPLLLFVGCYQFPMYLTPLLMKRFYRSKFSRGTIA